MTTSAKNKEEYLEKVDKQLDHKPLAPGMYLGFFIPSDGLVLRQVQNDASAGAPHVVAHPIAGLLDRK